MRSKSRGNWGLQKQKVVLFAATENIADMNEKRHISVNDIDFYERNKFHTSNLNIFYTNIIFLVMLSVTK